MTKFNKRMQTGNLLIILLIISSCTVRLIAPYDEVTDKKVSDLHELTMLTFKKWERDLPTFENAEEFYDQVDITLEILIKRNEAIKKSDVIVGMLEKIKENMQLIKMEHVRERLSSAFIQEIYPDINSQFNAIQSFQMSLKRSEIKL